MAEAAGFSFLSMTVPRTERIPPCAAAWETASDTASANKKAGGSRTAVARFIASLLRRKTHSLVDRRFLPAGTARANPCLMIPTRRSKALLTWMAEAARGIPGREAERLLHLLFLLVEQCIVAFGIAAFSFVVLARLGILVFVVFRDDVDVHRVRLDDFELGLAFRAAQNLAFFHFIFVDVDFDSAFGTANQCRNLLATGWRSLRPSVLYTGAGYGRVKGMSNREYPERPLVGVGGVVIVEGRVLLVRRGS